MTGVIRHGGDCGDSFRAGAVWRPSPGKRGALLHRALVEEASPSIRRLAGRRSREVQFHRFLRNERVNVKEMAASVAARTGERAAGRDVVVIQDTSEIALGGGKIRDAGFGPVGGGGATGGVLVHAAIAVDAGDGGLLGAVDIRVWNRSEGFRQTDRGRKFVEKESYRWLAGLVLAAERLSQAQSLTAVMDAEADIYELFALRPDRVHVLTRSARERKLINGISLSETVAGFAVADRIERVIPAAPGRKERIARLELRFGKVEIKAPSGLPRGITKSLVLSAVDVQEVNAPSGVTPIHWLLLTSHEVNDPRRAGEIVDLYKSRWWIEQLFRTLKSAGFRIEDSELSDPEAFINFAAVATIAAVSVMQLVKARDGGGQTIEACFEPEDKPLIVALSRRLEGKTARQKNPHPPGDLAFASWVIARLGGWTGYYGKPGPEVMRHGLDRFHAIKLGAQVAQDV
jgi:Transposase DDE domain